VVFGRTAVGLHYKNKEMSTNNKIGLLILGLIISLLTSCNSTKSLRSNSEKYIRIENNTISSLEGDYKSDLWKNIAPLKKRKKIDNAMIVRISIINEKRIEALLIKDDIVIAHKIIKGKVKNGFFSVRPKIYPIGIPIFFFFWYSDKVDIALTDTKDMLIAINSTKYGQVLLFLQGGGHQSDIKIFKKYEK
jgi:hypothetical protein